MSKTSATRNVSSFVPALESSAGGLAEILIPSASASFRGRPWTSAARVDGGRKLGNYEEKDIKFGLDGRNEGGVAEILLPSVSVSYRGRPWASAACVDGRWRWEMEKYEEKDRKIGLNGRNQGGVAEILIPSDSD